MRLYICYDAIDIEGIQGEACYELDVSEEIGTQLLESFRSGAPSLRWCDFEATLFGLERLRERDYVLGSIKQIQVANPRNMDNIQ